MLGALQSTDIGICLDTGHAYLSGDLQTVAQKLAGHLFLIHASDNQGHYDDHLPPGDGAIQWQTFLQHLRLSGFRGAMMLEIAGNPSRSAEEVLDAARRGRRYLRRISRRMGLPDESRHGP